MLSRNRAIVLSLIVIILSSWSNNLRSDTGWSQLADGMLYKKIATTQQTTPEDKSYQSIIHLFQIDLKKFKAEVVTAKQFGVTSFDAKTYVKKSGALLVINGGFFTPEYESLGLIVQKGREVNKLKWTSWWHIFQIKAGKPELTTKPEYLFSPDIEMAIESGPRLIVDGNITENLKPTLAERTAIGATADGQLMIAVTENYSISMLELAKILKNNGCYNALNLDGGSSTQLYAKFKGFELNRPGLNTVANGIGIFQR